MTAGKKALILFLFLLSTLPGLAQLQSVYTFQKDDTVLKRKLYERSVQKKDELVNLLGKDHKDEYKKAYERRLKEVKELLLSPSTVTDSFAHNYLQSIVNRIITANPELKGIDARVVFTRDWWPNAYSIGEGTIAMNAGLLVFMNNEAELAFALCHELAHYYLDHSGTAIKKYITTINSKEYQDELKRLSKEEYRVNEQLEKFAKTLVFDNRRHSRDKEAEADRQAFFFFKRTGYDGMAIRTSLEMLDKVDDSSLFKPLDLQQMFTFNEYAFKQKWIKKESVIFGAMGEDDGSGLTKKEKDSLKTHPDCAIRITLLADSMKLVKGKNFLVDEKAFNKLKEDFIAEMAELSYDYESLSRNLYFGLQLLQEEKYKPLGILTVVRALNLIYEKQKEHKIGLVVSVESKYFPEDYNLLLRLLNRIRLDEIAALSYYFGARHQATMHGYEGFEEELNKAKKYMN